MLTPWMWETPPLSSGAPKGQLRGPGWAGFWLVSCQDQRIAHISLCSPLIARWMQLPPPCLFCWIKLVEFWFHPPLQPFQSRLITPAHLLWCAFCSNKCDITVQTVSRSGRGTFNEGVWRPVTTLTHIRGLILNVSFNNNLGADCCAFLGCLGFFCW